MEYTKWKVEAEFKEMTTGKKVKPWPLWNLKFLEEVNEMNGTDDENE